MQCRVLRRSIRWRRSGFLLRARQLGLGVAGASDRRAGRWRCNRLGAGEIWDGSVQQNWLGGLVDRTDEGKEAIAAVGEPVTMALVNASECSAWSNRS